MNTGVSYKLFYEILLNLREIFHSYGRIDDSNAKLDEIIKLIMLSYYYAINGEKFSLMMVREQALKSFNSPEKVAAALRFMFEKAAEDKVFKNIDGTSIFGANASLNIQPSADVFAQKLITEIEKIDFLDLVEEGQTSNFDIINECFGHFVRENFRNNKEDAQYMTPAEIVNPVLKMVFNDFKKEHYIVASNCKNFKIMDPTCGVGTLLIESARQYINYINELNVEDKEKTIEFFLQHGVIGQDKVDRMVRLSKSNTLLMGGNSGNIFIGNSILDHTPIDEYKGKVDFIFSNPPFGAEYVFEDLILEDFKYLEDINLKKSHICSELLMLLKCISLLKENGKLAIVLPDSVFSATGVNAQVREIILSHYKINAVIEMPAVTFAQAGTRTKTSILYLTKTKGSANDKIVMSICSNIGYTVKERIGVPVKSKSGQNEMDIISDIYIKDMKREKIVAMEPSVTCIKKKDLIDNIINPNFYSAERLKALLEMETNKLEGFELRSLSELVSCETLNRKYKSVSESTRHISVLHILRDSSIDFNEVLNYEPISKGRFCKAGDILLSKINPKNSRIAVVPAFETELVCSNEFEILRPSTDIGEYALSFLLKTRYVASQIDNLTSGTSSSHCRIKREQLLNIKVPYPVSKEAKIYIDQINKKIEKAFNEKYLAEKILRDQQTLLEKIYK